MRSIPRRLGYPGILLLLAIVSGGMGVAKAWDEGSFLEEDQEESEKQEEGVDDGFEPFEKVVKDCERIDGLFPIYRNRDLGKLWLEITPDQLGKPYICALTREGAEGYFFDNSAMLDSYVFLLRREGKRIHWIRPNLVFRAEDDPAIARAIDRGVSSSLIGTLEIASKPHPERKSLLVDLAPFLLKDYGRVAARLKGTESGYSLDGDGSYVDTIRNFPKNTEIEVVLNFATSTPKVPVPTVPDARSFQHRYHWSLAERPGEGYRPRLADDRVGYFLTMLRDYSNTRTETSYVRYIERWRLEKVDPTAAISPPKEPIVFWLENTVPQEYREPLRRGILSWNRAFEAAGFRDAIVVKQMPDTAGWDPADIRYHVVRWMLQPGGSYAVGPSRADPLTGEIYDADIRIAADITRVVFREWTDQVAPISGGDRWEDDPHGCDLAEGRANQAAFGIGLAAARGLFDPESPEGRAYLDAYLEGLVCHEVGHTLGLRHNFKSSVINTIEELQDVERTNEVGIAGSIMDYAPVNLARLGEKQGDYWDRKPGVYDHWAIEYGYRPIGADSPEGERPELEKIASRAAEPLLAYGTDEDARGFSPAGIDPTSTLWDLGNDPIGWCTGRMELADELWTRMDSYLDQPGQRYNRYRAVFSQGLGEYRLSGRILAKYVGGIYHRTDHVGDPNGRSPFEPVSAATQRQVLQLLSERIFAEASFDLAPELLNKIAPDRMPTFDGGLWRLQRIDPPYHGMVLRVQAGVLESLYDPVRLSRIQDAELRFPDGVEPFRMEELFTELREAIWSELAAGSNTGSIRRNLQRAHLNQLIRLAVSPVLGTPEDATTLARADLKWIQRGCKRALGRSGLDRMTRAHLDETSDRIDAALRAPLERPLPDPTAGPRM